MHYKNKKCHYVSLEVGLGGRNDTTNIVNPEISVITSIGLDHTELLGPTEAHIAREKAGIIKKDRPVVLGPKA
jgi:dihydrofolate synthase/folylpolyglutamate synthase